MIAFGPETCQDFALATQLEWLETNGLGGYASSTIVGANTRRYHGLLVAAQSPPAGRVHLLAKLEESLIVGGERFDLSCNQYPEIVFPEGHRYLEAFRLDPFPVFTYRVPGAVLEKSLFLAHGESTLVVFYRLAADRPVLLDVRPLISYRSFHNLARETDRLSHTIDDSGGRLRITPFGGMPSLLFVHGGTFHPEGYWYRSLEYVEEAYRGYDFHEDLYSHGWWRRLLEPGREVGLVVSTAEASEADAYRLRASERHRRAGILRAAGSAVAGNAGDLGRTLALAADQLLVTRRDALASVVAGYPWLPEAGREAAIALPGLAIATGRHREAREAIRNLLQLAANGLVPVSFSEDGEGEPSSFAAADVSLWVFVAVHEYLRETGDEPFVRSELASPLLAILHAYERGTLFGIEVGDDGLLDATAPGIPLTWMNAQVEDWVATERRGRAVEVCALWINALRIGAEVARIAGENAEAVRLESRAAQGRKSFRAAFWDASAGYLRDLVGDGSANGSLRPNQAIALGLPHPVLGAEESRRALRVIKEKLWTPRGLRTLAPDDAHYRGRCIGDVWLREGAVHQGTVWPWLLGPYLRAVARTLGHDAARTEAAPTLAFLGSHLREAGLGTVSEIFDGDPPHTPRGAPASALSVAELVRVVRDFGKDARAGSAG